MARAGEVVAACATIYAGVMSLFEDIQMPTRAASWLWQGR
jgi:hypothetical protein